MYNSCSFYFQRIHFFQGYARQRASRLSGAPLYEGEAPHLIAISYQKKVKFLFDTLYNTMVGSIINS